MTQQDISNLNILFSIESNYHSFNNETISTCYNTYRNMQFDW